MIEGSKPHSGLPTWVPSTGRWAPGRYDLRARGLLKGAHAYTHTHTHTHISQALRPRAEDIIWKEAGSEQTCWSQRSPWWSRRQPELPLVSKTLVAAIIRNSVYREDTGIGKYHFGAFLVALLPLEFGPSPHLWVDSCSGTSSSPDQSYWDSAHSPVGRH